MPFVKYVPTDSRNNILPFVTFGRSGRVLRVNRAAVATLGLEDKECATLYYDEDKERIGIQFHNADADASALNVSHDKAGNAMIRVRGFLKHFELEDMVFDLRFTPHMDKGMLIIQLGRDE